MLCEEGPALDRELFQIRLRQIVGGGLAELGLALVVDFRPSLDFEIWQRHVRLQTGNGCIKCRAADAFDFRFRPHTFQERIERIGGARIGRLRDHGESDQSEPGNDTEHVQSEVSG